MSVRAKSRQGTEEVTENLIYDCLGFMAPLGSLVPQAGRKL